MIEFSPRHEHDPRPVPQRVGEAVSRFIDTHYNPGNITEFEAAFDRIEDAMRKPENREKFEANIRPVLETTAKVLNTGAIAWDVLDSSRHARRAFSEWEDPNHGVYGLQNVMYRINRRVSAGRDIRDRLSRFVDDSQQYSFRDPLPRRTIAVGRGMAVLNGSVALVDALVTPRHQILKLGAKGLGFVGEKVAKRVA